MRKNFIKTLSVDGRDIRYVGEMLEEKTIFLATGNSLSEEGLVALYRSSLEIAANGYSALYIHGKETGEAIEAAFYSMMEGKLFHVIPWGLRRASRKLLSMALVSGGGVMSLEEDSAEFSREQLEKALEYAASISMATFYFEERWKNVPPYISSALDNGREVCLADSSLRSRAARILLSEGAPAVQSFSFFLKSPKFIAVPDDKGRYCFRNHRFAIMNLDGKH